MAKAEKTTILETKVVQTEGIQLDLTMAEARVLRLVLGAIGGSNKRNELLGGIYSALMQAGAEPIKYEAYPFDTSGPYPEIKDGPV
jgi:hypothetical protein